MNSLLKALIDCGEQFKDNSFTIVDMQQADQPLIYVNKYFLELTGYTQEEVLYRNCRFLQGQSPQEKALKALRSSLKQGVASYHDILNYTKDGKPFWNRLCLFPIEHEVIGLKYFIGIQLDVTQMKEADLNQPSSTTAPFPDIHDKIENPLEDLIVNTRALKYFNEDVPESLAERERITQKLTSKVRELTQYVASLKV